MSETSDLLRALSELTYKLHILNLRQAAADYNYLLEWWESPSINNGHHLKPNPAGKNTIDEHSHNCPIPYYVQNGIADDCLSIAEAADALNGIKSILAELKSSTEDSDEITAIDAFDEYANDLITVLTGEAPEPPTPPGPDPDEPIYLTVYFTNQGSAGTSNTRIGGDFGRDPITVYDEDGSVVPFDLTRKYTILGIYNYAGIAQSVDEYDGMIDVMGNLVFRPSGYRTAYRMELILESSTTIEAYLTNKGSAETTDTYCANSWTRPLFDADGNYIPYDSTKLYTNTASFIVNGDTAYVDFNGQFNSWSTGILQGRPDGSNYYWKLIIRVEDKP